MSDWFNAEDAAKYLGISSSNLYSLAQQGRVPSNKIGKVWRFSKTDLNIWLRANKPLTEFFVSAEAFIDDNFLLRDPQREGYSATLDFFSKGGQRAIVQLPVGCGKSGLISILPFGISRGRVLIIAPNLTIRDELKKNLDITNRRYCFWNKCNVLTSEEMMAGPYIAVLDGKDANIHDCMQSHIVLTNIQQLASSADKWLPAFPEKFFDMIIVDEGHHSAAPSWEKVFAKFSEAKVVNLTATPFRSDRKDIEGELVYRYSFKRAALKGYIKRLQAVYVAPAELYFTYKGDQKRHTLDEVLKLKEEEWFSRGVALAPECNKHIVDASLDKLDKLRQSGTHHQLIAVACSVAHAQSIRSMYAERGYEAAEIHSNMPEDKRVEVLQKLKSGLLDCIVQVQMLGEGFDHPHLSVAAIFRPFRSLSPYVQFVGRTMRVIVQNDARHPDNFGYVVSHIGLNLDRQLADFRELEREDKAFFEELIQGNEPEPPTEVLEGRARMKLRPEMVVHRELISEFFEEDFVNSDDEDLLTELKAHAELLGFDAEKIAEALKNRKVEKTRRVKASEPFPVQPQSQRRESRKRLQEEVKRTANILLNRLGFRPGGRELAYKYASGFAGGNNFVVAVQMINHEVDKILKIKSGQRATLRTEDFVRGMNSLEEILNILTRRLKRRATEDD
ncbi:MAG: DEAD/DEAH box helicase family protein [Methanolobus sp.]|uniref:DEAD/DEAH box helicase n=1 Tax=Methanolobus sp. TaxID=1874737 RepID=UPI00272F05B2|nr:DEAD/DEAH box helicase family protein [Methanolobus sp.]MDP2217495.1 DEAD/DEAH box helicase family protein [Methanolobus sp.]